MNFILRDKLHCITTTKVFQKPFKDVQFVAETPKSGFLDMFCA